MGRRRSGASKSTLGELEFLVLLAAARVGREAYAVPIAREIERRTGRSLRRATVYVTLQRLETAGLVVSALGPSLAERGGRPRRYYELTPRGVQLMRQAREAFRSMWQGLEPLLEAPE